MLSKSDCGHLFTPRNLVWTNTFEKYNSEFRVIQYSEDYNFFQQISVHVSCNVYHNNNEAIERGRLSDQK